MDCRKEADGARGPASSHCHGQWPTQEALGKVPNSARCHLGSGQPTLWAFGCANSHPSPWRCVLSQPGPSGRKRSEGPGSPLGNQTPPLRERVRCSWSCERVTQGHTVIVAPSHLFFISISIFISPLLLKDSSPNTHSSQLTVTFSQHLTLIP